MLQIQPNNYDVKYLIDQAKFIVSFLGISWSLFKAYDWVKSIKDNDLKHIQGGVNDLKTEIGSQTETTVRALDAQTNELKELRQDLRAFYAPVAVAARARGKRTPRKKAGKK